MILRRYEQDNVAEQDNAAESYLLRLLKPYLKKFEKILLIVF